MPAQVGQTISVAISVKDVTGTLADVGTGPTCAITLPDGTSTPASVSHDGTGKYTASLLSAQAGRHLFTLAAAGANSGGFPYSEIVDVWPADPRFLISLAEARDALNFGVNDTSHDDELRLYLASVTPVIEDIVGPLLPATKVQTSDGGKTTVQLYERPTAISSVLENGATLAASDYVLDDIAAVLYRGSSVAQFPWFPGVQNIVVTYTVGSAVIPPNVARAAVEEVRFLYGNSQQGGRPTFGQDNSDLAWTPSGFAVPRMVTELLNYQMRRNLPGIG